MTAPTINGVKYHPQPVDELLPAARQLAEQLGAAQTARSRTPTHNGREQMRIARTISALVLGVALSAGAASMAACGGAAAPISNGGADCEKDEQGEHYELRDPDCGYYDEDGNWEWFPWVNLGEDSEPPDSKKSSTKTQSRPPAKPTTSPTKSTTSTGTSAEPAASGTKSAKSAKSGKSK